MGRHVACTRLSHLCWQSVVAKKDREESLSSDLQSLSSQLPLVEFYRTIFQPTRWKLAVARIFIKIMKLLDEALVYYRSGPLGPFESILSIPYLRIWPLSKNTCECCFAAHQEQVWFLYRKHRGRSKGDGGFEKCHTQGTNRWYQGLSQRHQSRYVLFLQQTMEKK